MTLPVTTGISQRLFSYSALPPFSHVALDNSRSFPDVSCTTRAIHFKRSHSKNARTSLSENGGRSNGLLIATCHAVNPAENREASGNSASHAENEWSVEVTGPNTRRVSARIRIATPLESIWEVLTDYAHLGDFIPSLAVNEVIELRPTGARLLQVGQQAVALGFKFKARAVMEVEEQEEQEERAAGDGRVQRAINFTQVEGDFKLFKGTWTIEEVKSIDATESTLSYMVEVTPQRWLPVALVEQRLATDIRTNLESVKHQALLRYVGGRTDRLAVNP